MKRAIYILLSVAFLSSSCEKVIEINVPEKERKIVLNALVNPDSVFTVHITRSKTILESNTLDFIDDADASLFENGEFAGSLEYMGYDKYILPGFVPQTGNTYRIEVEHPVLKSVQSEITVPAPVSITETDTSRRIGEFGNEIYNLNIHIDDPDQKENFYSLSMFATLRYYDFENEVFLDSTRTESIFFRPLDEGNNEFGEGFLEQQLSFFMDNKLFFSDAPFRTTGGELVMALEYYLYFFAPDTINIKVRLDHIDKSYYLYSLTRRKYSETNENPFSEPVQVYNNIQNGFGIFTSYASDTVSYSIFAGGGR
jgi:hypothetical protein